MSLPAHLRSLVSAAADRVRHDREVAKRNAEQIQRTSARAVYRALSAKYDDATMVVIPRPSWSAVPGYMIGWDDCHSGGWGPCPAPDALEQWMAAQFADDGLFPARIVPVPQTSPPISEYVWPTYEAALAAVLAIDPNSAAYQARRAA